MRETPHHFSEEQKFSINWQLFLFLPILIIMAFLYFEIDVIQQTVMGNIIFWVSGLPVILGALLMGLAKLHTKIDKNEINLRFGRLKRTIAMDEISRVYVRDCRPIREYGGWGYRWNSSGKAFLLRGNRGVQLELGNGEGVFIGSARAETLERAVERARGNKQG